jgi:hypothetical protein
MLRCTSLGTIAVLWKAMLASCAGGGRLAGGQRAVVEHLDGRGPRREVHVVPGQVVRHTARRVVEPEAAGGGLERPVDQVLGEERALVRRADRGAVVPEEREHQRVMDLDAQGAQHRAGFGDDARAQVGIEELEDRSHRGGSGRYATPWRHPVSARATDARGRGI